MRSARPGAANLNLELTHPFRVFGRRELDVSAFLHYHQILSMSRAGASRQIVEDARLGALGLDVTLVLDPEFSLAQAFGDFASRSGNRGSFFARASLERWGLGLPSGRDGVLIPAALSEGLGDFTRLVDLRRSGLALGVGYAYDWNFRPNFFFGAKGDLGLSASELALSFAPGDKERSLALGISTEFRLAISYVQRDFHTGLVAGATIDLTATRGVDVLTQRMNTLLFAGTRF